MNQADVEREAQAKETFWREWAIDGMPKDKQRLAEAAWNDAITTALRQSSGATGGGAK